MPLSLIPSRDETLYGLSLAIRAGQRTCREVFERCRLAVAEREPSIKAWITFGGDVARNCLVTPHIAWASQAARSRLMRVAVSNVRAFLAGQPVNVVN